MELVSAAKMRRAVTNVLATRAYATLAWQLLTELSSRTSASHHPLLAKRYPLKRIGLILVTSNRGLCGGFNHQLVNRVNAYLDYQRKQQADLSADLVAVGRRGRDISLRMGYSIAAEFTKPDITTKLEEVTAVAKLAISDYLSGRYDKVAIAYTDFISPVAQKPRIKQLLPIEQEEDEYLGAARLPEIKQAAPSHTPLAKFNYEYKFEPNPDMVLENLLPRLIEVQVYQAMLESDASEHSARMLAMRNASDAAKDMIDDLTLAFNQARQQAITAELADITGGRVAVEG
jgi:F-type H+-transporting ATPase subunit gamma